MDKRIESLYEINFNDNIGVYVCHCPNCHKLGKRNDDYKLTVNLEENVFHCFRCNWSGRADTLLRGVIDGSTLLRYKMEYMKDKSKYKTERGTLINTELIDFNNISTPIDKYLINAVKYLKKRHMTFEEIEKYNIRIGNSFLYKGRILIPTYDLNGNVVYLVARDYINENPESKYINPPGSHKSLAVWNIQNMVKGNICLVTEGVFSGIAANRNTPDDVTAVSIFGKVLSDRQAEMINQTTPREVALCFDGDVNSDTIINNVLTLNKFYSGLITIIHLHGEEDPDSIDAEEFKKRFSERTVYNKYKIKFANKIKHS